MQEMQETWVLSPGGGNGNPPHYSCLENSMDRGVWQAAICGVTKSGTQLSILARSDRVVSPSVLWNWVQRIQQPLLVGTGGPLQWKCPVLTTGPPGSSLLGWIRFLFSVPYCLQGNKSGRGSEESHVCSRTLQSSKGERRIWVREGCVCVCVCVCGKGSMYVLLNNFKIW